MNLWLFSNRQPWTDMVVNGIISSKTRKRINIEPKDLVFLHASKADWYGWQKLSHPIEYNPDVNGLPHGGVYGIAQVEKVGPTETTMPDEDKYYFYLRNDKGEIYFNCAMSTTITFSKVIRLPFVACRGTQQPAKKLPAELVDAMNNDPVYVEALKEFGYVTNL